MHSSLPLKAAKVASLLAGLFARYMLPKLCEEFDDKYWQNLIFIGNINITHIKIKKSEFNVCPGPSIRENFCPKSALFRTLNFVCPGSKHWRKALSQMYRTHLTKWLTLVLLVHKGRMHDLLDLTDLSFDRLHLFVTYL